MSNLSELACLCTCACLNTHSSSHTQVYTYIHTNGYVHTQTFTHIHMQQKCLKLYYSNCRGPNSSILPNTRADEALSLNDPKAPVSHVTRMDLPA